MDGRCKDKVKYDKCDEYWSSLYRSRLDNIQYRYGKNITRYGISKIWMYQRKSSMIAMILTRK